MKTEYFSSHWSCTILKYVAQKIMMKCCFWTNSRVSFKAATIKKERKKLPSYKKKTQQQTNKKTHKIKLSSGSNFLHIILLKFILSLSGNKFFCGLDSQRKCELALIYPTASESAPWYHDCSPEGIGPLTFDKGHEWNNRRDIDISSWIQDTILTVLLNLHFCPQLLEFQV